MPPTDQAPPAGDPPLPGVKRVDPALVARLDRALEAKGPRYEPHTRHRFPDGKPRYTNRLILESSPYLLQHAHNPVDWFPWGDAAFERARAEHKPVFLSIGYSTCHWCHVMEQESFEDTEIATFLNEHFVCIKVDREQRPDVDAVYMTAVEALTGQGGWPMTLLLTPDREPFFAGTYFPPRAGARGARVGLLEILRQMASRYATDRASVVARAEQVSRHMEALAEPAAPGAVPTAATVVAAARAFASRFDPAHGGSGGAPKFPQPARLDFLLRYAARTGDPGALEIVRRTLVAMADGGIYDHIGGGFHRYATDARWRVPHFEKMLYDNAQLAALYVAAYQLDGDARFARVARETLDYVHREMTSPAGGFYTATDADSEDDEGHSVEGWFFTWPASEVRKVLGAERAKVADAVWGITPAGNFEGGRNILYVGAPLAESAKKLGVTEAALRASLESSRRALFEARAKRKPPHLDDKIVAEDNGLMIGAFARASLALDEPRYLEAATRAASFVLDHLRAPGGALGRSFAGGAVSGDGYLGDYAAMIAGLLDLYEASAQPRWLEAARALQAQLDAHFWDAGPGGYFRTADTAEKLPMRTRPGYDGAVPSGNSLEASNLLRLAQLDGGDAHRARAERIFEAFSQMLERAPLAVPRLLSALEAYHDVALEVVVVRPADAAGEGPRAREAAALASVVRGTYLPGSFVALCTEAEARAQAARVPLFDGKAALHDAPTAFVCERGRCKLPTSDPAALRRQIAGMRRPLTTPAPAPLAVPER